ncbi:PIG-L deacetylase family protein [Paractinoplanes durhamensis]|uniref:PIG-L deacetylase family protein n=1 Tax=Paractinoplanes durhamensis TaxID=113563 RepID=UPI00363CA0D3
MLGAADLVAVTDGEASHPGSTVYPQEELAAIRQAETDEALRRLRVTTTVYRLGQPDGGIDEERLAADLARLLTPGRWCLTTWRGDGHPDHETVGRATARACAATGRACSNIRSGRGIGRTPMIRTCPGTAPAALICRRPRRRRRPPRSPPSPARSRRSGRPRPTPRSCRRTCSPASPARSR